MKTIPMRRCRASQFRTSFLSLTPLVHCLVPASCHAEQFVLFDVTFKYTKGYFHEIVLGERFDCVD